MKNSTLLIMASFVAGLIMQPVQAGNFNSESIQADAKSACQESKLSREGTCEDGPVSKLRPQAENPEATGISPQGAGIPAYSCRAGYYSVGPRLCMTTARGPDSFANAAAYCQAIYGRVADYGDWRYRILYGDRNPAPVGWWLGPITADNTALYVNLSNIGDFDGETSRFDSRYYACAHDVF